MPDISPTTLSKIPKSFSLKKAFEAAKPKDWVEGLNLYSGLAFAGLAPLTVASILASKNSKEHIFENNPTSSLVGLQQILSYLYPLCLVGISGIDLLTSLLSASPLKLLVFGPQFPLSIWNAINEFKVLKLTKEILELHQKPNTSENQAIIQSKQIELGRINALIGLFTKVFCLGFLYIFNHLSILADISGDTPLGKNLATVPFSKRKVKNIGDYFALLKRNALQSELPALKNAVDTVLHPAKWRGTLFGKNEGVNEIIRKNNYSGWSKFVTLAAGGSLKSALCLLVPTLRLLSGLMILFSLKDLGIGALNLNSKHYSKQDEKLAKAHTFSQTLFTTGNNIASSSLWIAGLIPLLSMSPSNLRSSGYFSALARTLGGVFYFSSGLSDSSFLRLPPVVGRSLFYTGEAFFCWSLGLKNIHRLNKQFQAAKA